jgi:hypothetical protein
LFVEYRFFSVHQPDGEACVRRERVNREMKDGQLTESDGDARSTVGLWIVFFLAVGVFSAGLLVYFFDRAQPPWFVERLGGKFSNENGRLFGQLSSFAPSFAHNFAFCIFTALSGDLTVKRINYSCIFWMVSNLSLEFSQIRSVSAVISHCFETTLGGVIDRLKPFSQFHKGTFDWADIAAILVSTVMARTLLKVFVGK